MVLKQWNCHKQNNTSYPNWGVKEKLASHSYTQSTSICFPSSGFNLLSYIKNCTLQFLFSILTLFTQRFPTHFSDFSVSQKPNQVSSQLKFFQRGNIVVGDAKKVYFMCILVPPIELSFSSLLKIWKAWRCLQRTLKSCYVCVSYLPNTHDHHQSSIVYIRGFFVVLISHVYQYIVLLVLCV
jgi:hypothetical protein